MSESTGQIEVRDEDREFFERELANFVPPRVFDAHGHLWPAGHVRQRFPQAEWMPESVSAGQYAQAVEALHPGRELGALFIPFPLGGEDRGRMDEASAWVAREAATDANRFRGLYFVRPEDDPAKVHEQCRRLGCAGLKCYHTMAKVAGGATWEADVETFLPDAMLEVANDLGLVVVLHLVKSRAAADPRNLKWIGDACRRFPDMKLILAHSARGFQPAHNLEGLPRLAGLDNLYFDTSANCEPMAHEVILRVFGAKRLMYGSDFPVSHFRGRSLGAADSFLWLYEEMPVWGPSHARVRPVLVGLEHLRSLKWACWSQGLSDSEVEDIFWNNAAGLLGVK